MDKNLIVKTFVAAVLGGVAAGFIFKKKKEENEDMSFEKCFNEIDELFTESE